MSSSTAFRPAWWLRNPHAQTFAGRYMRPRAAIPLERCRIGTPDGDFLDLDYAPEPAPGAPVVVLLHGLEGSTRRGYMSEMFHHLFVRGLRGVGMNFRGCGGDHDIGDQGKVRAMGLDGADGQERDDARGLAAAPQPGPGQLGPGRVAPGRPVAKHSSPPRRGSIQTSGRCAHVIRSSPVRRPTDAVAGRHPLPARGFNVHRPHLRCSTR